MQSVSSRIWTRVALSISYDDNHYTTGTSFTIHPYGLSLQAGHLDSIHCPHRSDKYKSLLVCQDLCVVIY